MLPFFENKKTFSVQSRKSLKNLSHLRFINVLKKEISYQVQYKLRTFETKTLFETKVNIFIIARFSPVTIVLL